MINTIYTVSSKSYNPYQNLALEEALFEKVDDNTLILYLWQNQHTVVIGRNQNTYKECKVVELENDKGRLARRLSGGGAVYHDLGNLNFTFLLPSSEFNIEKQCQVLLEALKTFGIDAYAQGRNDLLINNQKFSGHAYYHHQNKSYHHGTLMVNVDFNMLSHYLNVSKQKLQGKGVSSVIKRVTNLKEHDPTLTIEKLKEALIESAEKVYGIKSQPLTNLPDVTPYVKKYSDSNWLIHPDFNATYETSNKFNWGEIQILLKVKDHKMVDVEIYTDAMNTDLINEIKMKLTDELFSQSSIEAAINSLHCADDIKQNLISLFKNEDDPFR